MVISYPQSGKIRQHENESVTISSWLYNTVQLTKHMHFLLSIVYNQFLFPKILFFSNRPFSSYPIIPRTHLCCTIYQTTNCLNFLNKSKNSLVEWKASTIIYLDIAINPLVDRCCQHQHFEILLQDWRWLLIRKTTNNLRERPKRRSNS